MKQSAVKTIGAAALGAAFAVAAAGSASAAPALPDVGGALDTLGVVTETLPLEAVAEKLPAPASEVVTTGRAALDTVKKTAPQQAQQVQKAGQKAAPKAAKAADPLSGLLGGLPIGGLTGNGLNGIPLG
ncbi:ATP-binding protein [Streptomyces paludis]|uniref:ATP-binding protein n=1 Tax=Streptomyces paludis TaxID=2282738 RepID=A0A345HT90_9ACTN|nr:ATP-binding protein [Streptomyces paludis]AXG79914.1 ATP-binding protein [Streptomyces paludis]